MATVTFGDGSRRTEWSVSLVISLISVSPLSVERSCSAHRQILAPKILSREPAKGSVADTLLETQPVQRGIPNHDAAPNNAALLSEVEIPMFMCLTACASWRPRGD